MVPLGKTRSAADAPRRLPRSMQLRAKAEDPKLIHALRIHPQNLDIRAGTIHPKPDPPDAGTEHLSYCFRYQRASLRREYFKKSNDREPESFDSLSQMRRSYALLFLKYSRHRLRHFRNVALSKPNRGSRVRLARCRPKPSRVPVKTNIQKTKKHPAGCLSV